MLYAHRLIYNKASVASPSCWRSYFSYPQPRPISSSLQPQGKTPAASTLISRLERSSRPQARHNHFRIAQNNMAKMNSQISLVFELL